MEEKRSEKKTRKEATEYSEEQRKIACENSRFSSCFSDRNSILMIHNKSGKYAWGSKCKFV